ncbi:universal stress protein [Catenulispora subtropica]|uniref:Universal stress protein n=1 Tax=Catenulispora subtropica TaxID=450798 RepID=A0ABP5EWM0_9ACTN
MTAPVVVGVDDLRHSGQALDLAAHEAELRGAPLWVGHAYSWVPPVAAGLVPGGDTPEGAVRDLATGPQAEALMHAHAAHPDLEVHSYAMSGRVAPELAALAKDAGVLVIGERGRGGFAGMLLGTTAARIIAHARCPVIVARGASGRENKRVLAGLDVADSAGSAAVLGFAFGEAALRGAGLVAVHTWSDEGAFHPDPIGDYTRDTLAALDADRRRLLDAALAPWRGEYPGVPVEIEVGGGSAARTLVDASAFADLLVIGGRPHRDEEGMRLGALAYSLLHHAQCPVAIVPDR